MFCLEHDAVCCQTVEAADLKITWHATQSVQQEGSQIVTSTPRMCFHSASLLLGPTCSLIKKVWDEIKRQSI